MQKTSLFIINTPFQALCAIEAIREYKLTDPIIVLLRNPKDKQNFKTEKILSDFSLKYSYQYFHSYAQILKKRLLKTLNNEISEKYFDMIFIGDYYSSSFRLFASLFVKNGAQIILLDDGNSTLFLYNKGFNTEQCFDLKVWIKHKVTNLFYLFYDKKKIIFFSIFKPHHNNFLYKENKLSLLKPKNKTTTNIVYIIGSPLVELEILTKEQYILYLQKVIDLFSHEKIVYYPHRRENKTKTIELCNKFNFELFDPEYTIEYDFFIKNIIPKALCGFGSTALYTLKLINKEVEVYSLNFHSTGSMNSLYNIISEAYRQVGIKIIE